MIYVVSRMSLFAIMNGHKLQRMTPVASNYIGLKFEIGSLVIHTLVPRKMRTLCRSRTDSAQVKSLQGTMQRAIVVCLRSRKGRSPAE